MFGNTTFKLFLGSISVLILAGCVTAAATVKKPSAPINKVAVASFTVSNWGGSVSGTAGTARATELINSRLSGLVTTTENRLAKFLHVSKAAGFISNAGYRKLGVKNELGLMLPKVNGVPYVLFTKSNDDMIAAKLDPEVARKLCAELQVDAVVVVYSEWAVAYGRFVPTQRALAKDVVSVWDRKGNQVYFKRVDETGSGVLGGPYSPVVVNEGTIKQWSEAYNNAFEQIAQDMKTVLKP